jgi:hypothetical protein
MMTTTTVTFADEGSLGLVFERGALPITIAAIKPGSPAACVRPQLCVGQQLLCVQGTPVATYAEVVQLLGAAGRPVMLAFSPAASAGKGGAEVAKAIERKGAQLSAAIGRGAARLGAAAQARSDSYQQNAAPLDEPTDVSGSTQARLARAKRISAQGLAASQSALSFVSTGLKQGSEVLFASPLAPDATTAADVSGEPEKTSASLTKEGLGAVATAGAEAAKDVWYSLREGLRTVSSDVADATASAVEHRHGAAAGAAARDGLGVVEDVAKASFNLSNVVAGPVAAAQELYEVAAHRGEWLAGPVLREGLLLHGRFGGGGGWGSAGKVVHATLRPHALALCGRQAPALLRRAAAGAGAGAGGEGPELTPSLTAFVPLEDVLRIRVEEVAVRGAGGALGEVASWLVIRTRDDVVYWLQPVTDVDAAVAAQLQEEEEAASGLIESAAAAVRY